MHSDSIRIGVVVQESDAKRCWPAFRELRPHLTQDEFIRRWHEQSREGYILVCVEEGEHVPAAIGYRLMHTMAWGRNLYVDDLVAVAESHGRGLGTALLKYVQGEARRLNCVGVHLDTGYQRHAAHRVYLKNGFHLNCHHMAWQTVDH